MDMLNGKFLRIRMVTHKEWIKVQSVTVMRASLAYQDQELL